VRGLWSEVPDAKVLLNNVILMFPAWRGVCMCLLTEDEKMNALGTRYVLGSLSSLIVD